jgi:3-dehydrosphinganine reductase
MKDLDGKNVVITGGSYGIGLEIARVFLRQGANVFTVARNKEKLDASVEGLKKDARSNRTVLGYSSDVGDWPRISETIKQIAADNGGIDVVINNAGIYVPDYFERQDVEIFEKTDRTNYLGSVFTTKAALPFLLERKKSAVVFVSSAAGIKGIFGYSSYSPTKAAVLSLAEAVKSELKDKGLQVTVLCPPDVDTPGHAEELKIRPPECDALAESAGLMTASEMAEVFMEGFKKGKFMVIGGFDTKLLYRLNGISPRFVDFYFDRLIAKCRKKNK